KVECNTMADSKLRLFTFVRRHLVNKLELHKLRQLQHLVSLSTYLIFSRNR
ncbi:unnamed protein product, partial [Trichobilharzia szidati]